jgi:hypothetical protein
MDPNSEIISDPSQILLKLHSSKEQGTAIGIWAQALGEGLHMCGIENIMENKSEKIIDLKETDLNGVPLRVRRLSLFEISTVYTFRISFK